MTDPRTSWSGTSRGSSTTHRKRTSPTAPPSSRTRRRTSSSGRMAPRSPLRRSSRWSTSGARATRTGRRSWATTCSATAPATTPRTPKRCTTGRRATGPRIRPRRADSKGRLWLQYWLFYYYNDYNLVGRFLGGGRHEGDWELVQLRLNADEQPELAVYSQHKTAEAKPWANDAQGREHATRLRRTRFACELLRRRFTLHRHMVRPGRR